MKFIPTKIEGVWIIELERHYDERGWFARSWSPDELKAQGLDPCVTQCSSSFNARAGTLRGMHYQVTPHEETKIIRCTRGTIFDVALDLRSSSPTFKQWIGLELTADNGLALYVPKGCAHGFQTLTDASELLYMIAGEYVPQSARGARWNDPAFGISWPISESLILNQRDRDYADFAT